MRVTLNTNIEIDPNEVYDELSYRDQQAFIDDHLDDATIPRVLEFAVANISLEDVINEYPQHEIDRYFEEHYGEK